jgi:hypothetical protein
MHLIQVLKVFPLCYSLLSYESFNSLLLFAVKTAKIYEFHHSIIKIKSSVLIRFLNLVDRLLTTHDNVTLKHWGIKLIYNFKVESFTEIRKPLPVFTVWGQAVLHNTVFAQSTQRSLNIKNWTAKSQQCWVLTKKNLLW